MAGFSGRPTPMWRCWNFPRVFCVPYDCIWWPDCGMLPWLPGGTKCTGLGATVRCCRFPTAVDSSEAGVPWNELNRLAVAGLWAVDMGWAGAREGPAGFAPKKDDCGCPKPGWIDAMMGPLNTDWLPTGFVALCCKKKNIQKDHYTNDLYIKSKAMGLTQTVCTCH